MKTYCDLQLYREFSVYNDVWVVKLFMCCHIIAVLLTFCSCVVCILSMFRFVY